MKVKIKVKVCTYLIVESRIVRAPHCKELDKPLVKHLLPFCHHVPLQVAEGLLAGEGDLEELGELCRQMLMEEEEVAVSTKNLPPNTNNIFSIRIAYGTIIDSPCFFPPDSQDIVDKLFSGPILSSKIDVLDLGAKLTKLATASSASDASARACPPMPSRPSMSEHSISRRAWTPFSSLKALECSSVRAEKWN